MRAIGLDVHLEFCEVAIAEGAELRSAGRIATRPEEIELFAQSLGADDRVALEVTGNAWEIKRLIEPHVAEVIVVSPGDTGIRSARAKTDRLDARALARLLAAGELESVWVPDRATQVMRRRLQRRGQLVSARSRAKNQIHASLMRCLVGRAPFSDLFGAKGRRWLGRARAAGGGARVGRLRPAPGRVPRLRDRGGRAVDLGRRPRERRGEAADDGAGGERDLRGDLHGGDRRDRPLPLAAASWSPTSGSIRRCASRARARPPRADLEAGHRSPAATRWSRRAGRRCASRGRCAPSMSGSGPAAAAASRSSRCARKLACLFWCLLSRGEDYAFAQPSLTRARSCAGSSSTPAHQQARGRGRPPWLGERRRCAEAERELAEQAEAAYRRTRRATGRRPRRRERAPARHRGAHLVARQAGKQRGRSKPQGLRFSSSSTGARVELSQIGGGASRVDLTFMRRPKRLLRTTRRRSGRVRSWGNRKRTEFAICE